MATPFQTERVLVTGADGTVGRVLVGMLLRAGALVRAGLHHADRLAADDELGPDPVAIDFLLPESLLAAMDGVEVVYLLTPQLPESVEYVRAAVTAARTSGVQRIVRQSVFNAPDGSDAIARWHREAEELIAASGLRYTFVRANSFMQNFATLYRRSIVERDSFSLPLGDARLSNVDVRDVAAAATALLLDDEFDGTVSTLTGPESLSGEEMARVLTGVTGRLIRYRDEPEDEGTPAGPVDAAHAAERDALRELGAELRAGRLAAVTDDVGRLTGRQPLTFEQFARDHAWVFSRHPFARDESEGVSYG